MAGDERVVLLARVEATMRDEGYFLWVVARLQRCPRLTMDDLRDRTIAAVLEAECSCPAGKSGCCVHVLAALLRYQHYSSSISSQYRIGSVESPTSLACVWIGPATSTCHSKRVQDVIVTPAKLADTTDPVRRLIHDQGKKHLLSPRPDPTQGGEKKRRCMSLDYARADMERVDVLEWLDRNVQ